MIHQIRASAASFKTLDFRPGLNILRADRSAEASDRDSRNGAGKTSFVELVHFLFGSSAPPKNIFRSDALGGWRFEAELELGGVRGTVSRSGSRPNAVEVSDSWIPQPAPPAPRLLDCHSNTSLDLDLWKTLLGERWFGLEPPLAGEKSLFRPGFRSLFSYFARRERDGGFIDPMRNATTQQPWDQQVSVSWLLNLDWTVAQRFQRLREREKLAKALKAAARSGEFTRLTSGAAELRTALTLTRSRALKTKERLDGFRVLEDYEDLESEADRITGRMNDLAGENLADRALLRELETSLRDEEDPENADIRKLFDEAGVVLPDLVHRRFDEVDQFHRRVLENRRAHLNAEIESASERIAAREKEKEALDARRRQIMGILESGGALAEYTALREEAGRVEAEVEGLAGRLRDAEKLEGLRTDIKAERARLTKSLQDDIRERDAFLQEAILRFEALSESLYERAGSLTIDWSEKGPKFEVRIPSGQSLGISRMQIFCFDMMLMELQSARGCSPGFLIHDSHLFDGVDERQVARALQLGARRAEAGRFQYIVTLNTDVMPREGFDRGFAIEDFFMDVRLTDADETGGLFGIRFDWNR